VALMPDTIPGDYRSEANGVINMMGGFGLIAGTLGLARLMNINESLPFNIASVCIILATAVLFFFVHEKKPEQIEDSSEAEQKISVLDSVKKVFSSGDHSVALILVSIFCWFLAYEGVKPFLGLFMIDVMGVSEGNAALGQGIAGISGVAFAILTGYIAHKMGRRRYIRLCLVLLALVNLAIPIVGMIVVKLGLSSEAGLAIFLFLMLLYGGVWIGIVVNSFPMLWQMATFTNMGIYTGLYYTFSQSAAILAPTITGLIIDLAGYYGVFFFSALCMIPAWIAMGKVKAGEAS
jgi:MFS family permease